MKITDIYKQILDYAGLEADENGYVFNTFDKEHMPVVIDGKRLVLPYEHHQKNPQPDEKVIFHPLNEIILQGESEVIQKLRHYINVRLNFTFAAVAVKLLTLIASEKEHGKLTPDQTELLLKVKEVDHDTIKNFAKVMKRLAKVRDDNVFVHIFLKKGGTYAGEKHSCVGIVNFPLYKELKEDKITGIRDKDKEAYLQLFKFIFPQIDDPEGYNYGSDSHIARFLEALMRTSANLASPLNDLLDLYHDFIDGADKLMFSSDWMEAFNNLEALVPLIRRIPVQAGNGGTVPEPAKPQTAPAPSAAPAAPDTGEVLDEYGNVDFKATMEKRLRAGQPLSTGLQPTAATPYFPNQPMSRAAIAGIAHQQQGFYPTATRGGVNHNI